MAGASASAPWRFDLERGDVTGKHHVVFVHSVTVGHEWGAGVSGAADDFNPFLGLSFRF